MRFRKLSLIILLCSISFLAFSSCKKDKSGGQNNVEDVDSSKSNKENVVSLDKHNVSLLAGDTINLKPAFGSVEVPQKSYVWDIDNKDIAKIIAVDNKNYTLTLVAKTAGVAVATIHSKDKKLRDSCIITVDSDGVIKILAIGNSFSEDAVEHYLHGLATAEGVEVIIGNMYIGGASLEKHWANASGNKAVYSYRKIDVTGKKTTTPHTSISTAVADENWDYISFQQVSHETGQYATFVTPLPKLVNYVKDRTTNPNAKFVYHETWAYAENSDHSQFHKYNNDQMTMYHAIVDAVWRAVKLTPIDFVIPAGTAIQNGRTSDIGDHFNRDGYHLNSLGQYTAACTWFESIFKMNVVGNSYIPDGLSKREAEIAQHAAHAAVEKPKEITELTAYQTTPKPLEAPVFIGFGSAKPIDDAWNALIGNSGVKKGSSLPGLTDENGNPTGISLEITKRFFNSNPNGTASPSAAFDVPVNVSKYNFYGNARKERGGNNLKVVESEITLSHLDKSEKYDFCFFSSRASVTDNRETKFIVNGTNEVTTSLNASNNTSNTACANKVEPDGSGNIEITVTIGDNNDSEWGFYYLNAMRISASK